MKKQLLLSGMLAVSGFLSAQQPSFNPQNARDGESVEYCHEHTLKTKMQQEDPARFATMGTLPAASAEAPKSLLYTIPVVFHVIHNGGSENISAAQIQDALAILNRDYRRLNTDANTVHADFQGMPADIEIRFEFATIAPNGECFEGITRTQSTWTNDPDGGPNQGQQQVNAVVAGNDVYQGVWPHNKYLNIYVAKNINGAAGYTFNPNGGSASNATEMYYNGVFILHDYCGSIGTSAVFSSRALTHEVGHWLNLSHTWGDDNNPGVACGNDYVSDTPTTRGISTCNLDENYCGPRANVENYMDYSYCSKMFTEGQKTRMRNAIISSVGGRSNIWTTANLEEVGAIPGATLCGLDFNASSTTSCANEEITFTAETGENPITSYSWTFTGGTPASSTAASPVITYSAPGAYTVSLTVVSAGQSYTKTRTAYISVNANVIVSLPFTEGFASPAFPPANWIITNTNSSPYTWARSSSVGKAPTAGNSMMFDNYSLNDSDDDEIRLPGVNFTDYESGYLVFDVAYAPYVDGSDSGSDGLQILVSTDCGDTYTSVYSKSNTVLATAPAQAGIYTPATSQWRSDMVNLTPFAGEGNVIIKFRNLSGYGNRMFIDNINIDGVMSSAAPVAAYTPSSTGVCSGQTITFTNSSTGTGNTYSWTFEGGTPATSASANPTVVYASPGTYTVSMTATNAFGDNTTTQTNQITVSNPGAAPVITPNGPLQFCAGGNVVLSSSSASGNNWSTGASGTSVTVSQSSTVTLSVTTNGCTSAPATATITVNTLPSVSLSDINDLCIYNNPVTLPQGMPAGGTYSGTGVSGNQFSPATAGAGNKTITYTYTDANGCTGTAQIVVNVGACLSLEEEEAAVVNIYPNPSSGMISVDAGTELIESVTVYDQTGRMVRTAAVSGVTKSDMDLSQMAKGVYSVRVTTASSSHVIPVVIDK